MYAEWGEGDDRREWELDKVKCQFKMSVSDLNQLE